jgi:hypothetical protein
LCERHPRKTPAGIMQCSPSAAFRCLVRDAGKTSYWLSDTNEMVAIKTFLIIVNSFVA